MATLEEIRAKLLAEQKKTTFSQNNEIYPFWNIPEGTTATVRFLPDKDPDNTFFWKERLVIRLDFSGIMGGDEHKTVTLNVPCLEMFGLTDPILSETRSWFDPQGTPENDRSESDQLARKYWKKRSYLFQGFVTQDPLNEQESPENPIRRFVINSSIYDMIRESILDPEFTDMPTDYVSGRDFKLKRTKQGTYSSYKTSSWSMNPRSLSDDELASIETYGLYDLKEFLPNKPTEAHINAIGEMFEASVNGQLYDPSRWADYYKPFELNGDDNQSSSTSTSSPAQESPAFSKKTSDALENLRKRVNEDSTKETDVSNDAQRSSHSSKPDVQDIIKSIKERATDNKVSKESTGS